MTQAAPRLKYRPEIVGVRAVAVLAVLGFQVSFVDQPLRPYFGGGFLGVDLFFVLSGMLITELIVNDHLATNRAQLGRFYERRARRLIPALAVFLVLAVVYFQLDRHAGRATIRNYVSILTYVDFGHSFALAIPSYYLVERRFRLPSRRAAGAETDPVAPAMEHAEA